MTVATFQQTDYTSQTGTAYPLAIDADWAVAARTVDSFAPHAQPTPDMTVALDPGHVFNGVTLAEIAAQSTGAIAAPVNNPRIDRVVIDRASGAASVVAGIEAASPLPPAIPVGKAPVAQVLLQPGASAITNSMLTDERDLTALGLASGAYTNVGAAATLDVGTAPGNVVQLDGSGRLPAVDGSQLIGLSLVPPGVVTSYAGTSAPNGWLLCYGQAVSRTAYAALFAAVGTAYGPGDGSTTFNLPDLRGRAPFGVDNMGGTVANRITTGGSGLSGTILGATGGAEIVTLTVAQMPSHSHPVASGAGSESVGAGWGCEPLISAATAVGQTTGNAGGGGPHNNMPPTIILNYIIKT